MNEYQLPSQTPFSIPQTTLQSSIQANNNNLLPLNIGKRKTKKHKSPDSKDNETITNIIKKASAASNKSLVYHYGAVTKGNLKVSSGFSSDVVKGKLGRGGSQSMKYLNMNTGRYR